MVRNKRIFYLLFILFTILLFSLLLKRNKRYEGNENYERIDIEGMEKQLERQTPTLSIDKTKYIKVEGNNGKELQSIMNQMKLMTPEK